MKEQDQILQQAASEIKSLRRRCELAEARLQMFDDMNRLLHTEPARMNQGGMSPDLVYEIEKYLQSKQNHPEQ